MAEVSLIKDVIIVILRISSRFSSEDCNNARLTARYVRKDYIIAANFKAWVGFDKFINALNTCHEFILRNYECEQYFDFNDFNDNTDFIELEENINLHLFISKSEDFIKSLSPALGTYTTHSFKIITSSYGVSRPKYQYDYAGFINWSLDEENAKTNYWTIPNELKIDIFDVDFISNIKSITFDRQELVIRILTTDEIFEKYKSLCTTIS